MQRKHDAVPKNRQEISQKTGSGFNKSDNRGGWWGDFRPMKQPHPQQYLREKDVSAMSASFIILLQHKRQKVDFKSVQENKYQESQE